MLHGPKPGASARAPALPRLFSQVVIPPTVFRELQQPNTPTPVREWANSLPNWASVRTPKAINLKLDVDAGELEAICLAQAIKAAAVLMDVAHRCKKAVANKGESAYHDRPAGARKGNHEQ